jgi:hypothetical protein
MRLILAVIANNRQGGLIRRRTFRSSRCVIPGLAAGGGWMAGWPAAAGLRAAARHAGSGAQARRLTGAAAANTRATQVRVREGANI